MSEYVVRMENINKSFPGVKALDKAKLSLRPGKVMCLLGENGAGKSTLMKILCGVYTKDGGMMEVDGKEIDFFTPQTAKDAGIAIVHQELNMCNDLTVAENIFLGNEMLKGSKTLNTREMRKETKRILGELNIDISPDEVVSNLSVSKQQMVEIARAISFNSKILIMDEPTSALSDKEIEELFRIIRLLRDQGVAIVYISHRLAELAEIVDEVTIMRDGKFIETCLFSDITLDEIIQKMVGREITEQFPRFEMPRGEKIFEAKNINAGMVKDVSFSLYAGEIVAIAGLMGAGRTELTRAIFGADPKESGQFFLDGEEIFIKNSEDAIRQGLVLAPEDRRKDGLCVDLSVENNISLPNMDILCSNLGVINRKKEKEMSEATVKNLSIKLPTLDVNAATLSGGNQQKVVVGKWLARDSRVIMFDEPTRGIDVGTKVDIYNLMNELKKQGIAVLFVSSELPEVIGVSDRVLIMCDGRITGELNHDEATQDVIMQYATQF